MLIVGNLYQRIPTSLIADALEEAGPRAVIVQPARFNFKPVPGRSISHSSIERTVRASDEAVKRLREQETKINELHKWQEELHRFVSDMRSLDEDPLVIVRHVHCYVDDAIYALERERHEQGGDDV